MEVVFLEIIKLRQQRQQQRVVVEHFFKVGMVQVSSTAYRQNPPPMWSRMPPAEISPG